MKLIESKTLGTAQASIEFTSIPQDGTDLVAVASIRTTRANFADDIVFRFNGDTGTNYSYRSLYGTGSARDSGSGTISRGYFGLFCGDGGTSNTFGNGLLYIPNYTGSTQKSSSADAVNEQNSSPANQIIIAGLWTGTAAITSILFYSDNAANLLAGTTISLYKITKGSDGIVTTSP
jgi:hypothetical protein